MKLNELSPAAGSKKDRKRVGRGIGSGIGRSESGASPPSMRRISILPSSAVKIFCRVGSKPQHQLHIGSCT